MKRQHTSAGLEGEQGPPGCPSCGGQPPYEKPECWHWMWMQRLATEICAGTCWQEDPLADEECWFAPGCLHVLVEEETA